MLVGPSEAGAELVGRLPKRGRNSQQRRPSRGFCQPQTGTWLPADFAQQRVGTYAPAPPDRG